MNAKGFKVCFECNRRMERCRAVSVDPDGKVVWVCRQCWKALDYESFMYKHREGKDVGLDT